MKSVLIVDDSIVNRRIAAAALKRSFDVHTAENGKQAVDAIRKKPFALVVMDLDMPELNGIEATREIRSIEQFTGARVSIMAYSASGTDRWEECLSAGMDGFLQKPASHVQLLKHVHRLTEQYESIA